jgi:hypothetical protein
MNKFVKTISNVDTKIRLDGIDGANPLGFLAALGAYRLVASKCVGAKLSWQLFGGCWRPCLEGVDFEASQIGNVIFGAIASSDTAVWDLDKKLPFEAAKLKRFSEAALENATKTSRESLDWVASLGVDSIQDDKGIFKDTAFRMVRSGDSAGQGLLAYGKRLMQTTSAEEFGKALLQPWAYADPNCTLRWDPIEDRGYAFQWTNPSVDQSLSEKAANCLALFALPFYPTIPLKSRVETVGFGLRVPKKSFFTWPIWESPLIRETICSAIGLQQLQDVNPDSRSLHPLGISAVYRCARIMTSTYYANFTPSQRVA